MTICGKTLMAVTLGSMLLAGACVDDPMNVDDPDAGRPGGRPDATPGNMTPDAGNEPTGVVSNLPGVDWQAAPDSAPGIVILSSNYVQENLGAGSVYQDWYAEVENRGTSIACYVEIKLELQNASGAVLATPDSFADANPYKLGTSTLSSACIPPGGRGAIWDIANTSSEVPLAQIERGVYHVSLLVRDDAVPHPLAPRVVSANLIDKYGDGNYWAVKGELQGQQGTIRNIGMDVYAKGANGLLVDRLGDTNLGVLTPGQQWSYETTSFKGAAFGTWYQFVDFIEGASLVDDQTPRALAQRRYKQQRAQLRGERNARRADR